MGLGFGEVQKIFRFLRSSHVYLALSAFLILILPVFAANTDTSCSVVCGDAGYTKFSCENTCQAGFYDILGEASTWCMTRPDGGGYRGVYCCCGGLGEGGYFVPLAAATCGSSCSGYPSYICAKPSELATKYPNKYTYRSSSGDSSCSTSSGYYCYCAKPKTTGTTAQCSGTGWGKSCKYENGQHYYCSGGKWVAASGTTYCSYCKAYDSAYCSSGTSGAKKSNGYSCSSSTECSSGRCAPPQPVAMGGKVGVYICCPSGTCAYVDSGGFGFCKTSGTVLSGYKCSSGTWSPPSGTTTACSGTGWGKSCKYENGQHYYCSGGKWVAASGTTYCSYCKAYDSAYCGSTSTPQCSGTGWGKSCKYENGQHYYCSGGKWVAASGTTYCSYCKAYDSAYCGSTSNYCQHPNSCDCELKKACMSNGVYGTASDYQRECVDNNGACSTTDKCTANSCGWSSAKQKHWCAFSDGICKYVEDGHITKAYYCLKYESIFGKPDAAYCSGKATGLACSAGSECASGYCSPYVSGMGIGTSICCSTSGQCGYIVCPGGSCAGQTGKCYSQTQTLTISSKAYVCSTGGRWVLSSSSNSCQHPNSCDCELKKACMSNGVYGTAADYQRECVDNNGACSTTDKCTANSCGWSSAKQKHWCAFSDGICKYVEDGHITKAYYCLKYESIFGKPDAAYCAGSSTKACTTTGACSGSDITSGCTSATSSSGFNSKYTWTSVASSCTSPGSYCYCGKLKSSGTGLCSTTTLAGNVPACKGANTNGQWYEQRCVNGQLMNYSCSGDNCVLKTTACASGSCLTEAAADHMHFCTTGSGQCTTGTGPNGIPTCKGANTNGDWWEQRCESGKLTTYSCQSGNCVSRVTNCESGDCLDDPGHGHSHVCTKSGGGSGDPGSAKSCLGLCQALDSSYNGGCRSSCTDDSSWWREHFPSGDQFCSSGQDCCCSRKVDENCEAGSDNSCPSCPSLNDFDPETMCDCVGERACYCMAQYPYWAAKTTWYNAKCVPYCRAFPDHRAGGCTEPPWEDDPGTGDGGEDNNDEPSTTCDEACEDRADQCRSSCQSDETNDGDGDNWCDWRNGNDADQCCCERDGGDNNDGHEVEIVSESQNHFVEGPVEIRLRFTENGNARDISENTISVRLTGGPNNGDFDGSDFERDSEGVYDFNGGNHWGDDGTRTVTVRALDSDDDVYEGELSFTIRQNEGDMQLCRDVCGNSAFECRNECQSDETNEDNGDDWCEEEHGSDEDQCCCEEDNGGGNNNGDEPSTTCDEACEDRADQCRSSCQSDETNNGEGDNWCDWRNGNDADQCCCERDSSDNQPEELDVDCPSSCNLDERCTCEVKGCDKSGFAIFRGSAMDPKELFKDHNALPYQELNDASETVTTYPTDDGELTFLAVCIDPLSKPTSETISVD